MYEEDIPRYKKKAKKKSAAKADHKHRFEPCVFQLDEAYFSRAYGFKVIPGGRNSIGTYCPICGKVGNVFAHDPRYYTGRYPAYPLRDDDLTEEGRRQMDPLTRTIPCFYLGDPFANHKYVTLP